MGTRQIEGTSWTLSNGTLIIISTEAMLDYNDGRHAPWYKYRDLITTVAITNGVTRIGKYAFSECISLTSITIPNSVTAIGQWAFEYCRSLTSITIPNSVTTIGNGAFFGCRSLTSITIPNSVRCIGTYAFEDCLSLINVVVLRTSPPSIPKGSKAAYQRAEGWNEFGTIVDHSKNEEKQSDNEVTMDTKRCPYCGEVILAIAKKCKHCGEWLEQIPQKTKMATGDPFKNFYEEKQFSPVPGSGCTWTEEHSRNEEKQFFPVTESGCTWPEDPC
jgi:hypothetical protein